jgi:hypothetical protein
MFIFSCALIGVYVVALAGAPRMSVTPAKDEPPKPGLYVTRLIVFAVLFHVLSLYISIMFTPLHYLETLAQWVGIITLVVLLILFALLFYVTEDYYKDWYSTMYSQDMSGRQKKRLRKKWDTAIIGRDVAAVFFFLMTFLSDIIFLQKRADAIRDLLLEGGWIFLIFAILIPALLYRLFIRLQEAKERQNDQFEKESGRFLYYMIFGSGIVLFSLLLFTVLISYSYWIFPFIPSAKGGGDYEHASRVSIIAKPQNAPGRERIGAIDPASLDQSLILYSTSSSYYFARPERGNTPCDWRAGRSRPKINEVRRDEIGGLVLKVDATPSNCR